MQNQTFTKSVTNISKISKSSSSTTGKSKKKPDKNLLWKILIAILGLAGVGFLALWYFWEEPLLSPLSSLTTFQFITEGKQRINKNKKIVYGFLPYWSLNTVTIQPEITHLAYFSLGIEADGTITTHDDDGNQEPGYNKLDSEKLADLTNNDKMDIVLTQFDNEYIIQFLSSEEAHQNLLVSLDSIIQAYPINGVNIDIEYTGEVTEIIRQDMVTMMATVNNHLDKKYGDIEFSIDMYASAASKNHIWDVEKISQEVDYIIVMAYDFHRRSSTQAGPVAPLFGGDELWDSDINQHLKEFLKVTPKEKILLGVPFYGYEWQTTSREAQATTFQGTGSTATYKRVKELLSNTDELFVEEHWNEAALSPYLSYTEDDEIYVVYYEDPRSLEYKMEYVEQLDLAGIAIWALGYEGDGRELWDVVKE